MIDYQLMKLGLIIVVRYCKSAAGGDAQLRTSNGRPESRGCARLFAGHPEGNPLHFFAPN